MNPNSEETEKLNKIHNFMCGILDSDQSGHDSSHIDRVIGLTKKILKKEPTANQFIVLASATLHDTYDDKLFVDQGEAKKKVIDFLNAIDVDPKPIIYIIDNMSWSAETFGQAKKLDINGQIVQDADRLEAIGAIAIIRAFKYAFKHQQIDYDPKIKARVLKNKTDYRNGKQTTINHFYEKLFKIKDSLNTETAKQIAKRRDEFMHEFVKEYISEYNLDA
ncbi:putative Mn(2+)-dependent (deoxy)ribonucleoside pyrophosphohydrolase [Oenococcus oeni]|uniref:HD domain-containing protein n=1 Tax=Oenococcus oeni TaxID=1247 RepID=UPI0010B3A05E|nr:HD family phosphohydrolase [Oenococcus oeni]SYW01327.1 putative Mn(2+)-dependent (deoxy)ribonucleoside pyrophosphohydrolase [Oenococcus oeni]